MSNDESFEKYLSKQDSDMSIEFHRHIFNNLPMHIDEATSDDLYALYNAGKADQAERVKKLEKAGADLIRINMERTTENAQLQLDNQKLREALEWIAKVNACDYEYVKKAKEALGETK